MCKLRGIVHVGPAAIGLNLGNSFGVCQWVNAGEPDIIGARPAEIQLKPDVTARQPTVAVDADDQFHIVGAGLERATRQLID